MSINPMMMGPEMGSEELDLMAMQEAMGGGAPAGGMSGGEMTSVEVPTWAVEAVMELVSVLESEIASGNVTPEMLMGIGGDSAGAAGMPMGGAMGGGQELPPLPM
jgi:hypothetical protein